LTRRLAKEGRLHENAGVDLSGRAGDASLDGLNFDTLRPRADVLADQAEVLTRIYDPKAFFGRTRRMLLSLERHDLGVWIGLRDSLREIDRFFRIMWYVTTQRPDMRRHVWKLVVEMFFRKPRVLRDAMVATVFYVDLGPLSRFVAAHRKTEIAELHARENNAPGAFEPAARGTAPPLRAVS
jgi:hypothetical protein